MFYFGPAYFVRISRYVFGSFVVLLFLALKINPAKKCFITTAATTAATATITANVSLQILFWRNTR
jgi:hypothetical protein